MNAVFLDTVGILALLERSDQWHQAPTRAWSTLNEAGRPLRTTTLVLFECGNAVARKPYRRRIVELLHEFQADGALITPTEPDIESAWEADRRTHGPVRRSWRLPVPSSSDCSWVLKRTRFNIVPPSA